MGRLIVLAGILFLLYLLMRGFIKTPPQRIARILRNGALFAAIGLLMFLAASGRLNWVVAAISAAIPVLMRLAQLAQTLPIIRQLMAALGLGHAGTAAPAGAGRRGQTSSIRTRFLEMTLDHASGDMDGTLLDGPMQGRRLSELGLSELVTLLYRYRTEDQQSAAVLEAYLDRVHGDAWHARTGGGNGPAGDAPQGSGGEAMTQAEALAVLGLEPGASAVEIRDAHRRLMQKFHPDRGGSTYLAAKINQAKELLLGG